MRAGALGEREGVMDLPSCQNVDLESKLNSHAAAKLEYNTDKNCYDTIIPCTDGSCREGGVYCSFLWLPDDHSRVCKMTYLGQIT